MLADASIPPRFFRSIFDCKRNVVVLPLHRIRKPCAVIVGHASCRILTVTIALRSSVSFLGRQVDGIIARLGFAIFGPWV